MLENPRKYFALKRLTANAIELEPFWARFLASPTHATLAR